MNYQSFGYDLLNDNQPTTDNPQKLVVGVFFDGTRNNRKNVDAKVYYLSEQNKPKKEMSKDARAYKSHNGNASYENAHSNVDTLQQYYASNSTTISVYIEGAGTEDLKGDDLTGSAFGTGDRGIISKVEKACSQVSDKIKKIKSYRDTTEISFDIFGFSRGAAEARHFAYEIQKTGGSDTFIPILIDGEPAPSPVTTDIPPYGLLGNYLRAISLKVKNIDIKIRFVGLFDTVAAYNDPKSLHMNDVSRNAQYIIQFTADDEYRKHFALTPIITNGNKAQEISLPGAHSDIGGSYAEDCEDQHNQKLEIQYSGTDELQLAQLWYITQGWFQRQELTIEEHKLTNNVLMGDRSIKNQYGKIPLLLMYNTANEHFAELFQQRFMSDYKMKETDKRHENLLKHYLQARIEALLTYWTQHKDTLSAYARKEDLSAELQICMKTRLGNGPGMDELLFYFYNKIENLIQDKKSHPSIKTNETLYIKNADRICQESGIKKFEIDEVRQKLPALVDLLVEQSFFRVLRNQYLHWSSNYNSILLGVDAPNEENGRKVRGIIAG